MDQLNFIITSGEQSFPGSAQHAFVKYVCSLEALQANFAVYVRQLTDILSGFLTDVKCLAKDHHSREAWR